MVQLNIQYAYSMVLLKHRAGPARFNWPTYIYESRFHMTHRTATQTPAHHRRNYTRISTAIAAPSVRHTSRLTTWAYARSGAYARNWKALAARTVETSDSAEWFAGLFHKVTEAAANEAGPDTILTDEYYN